MSVLTGKKAPSFNTKAVVNGCEIVENFSIEQFLNKKYVLLIFYTKNFSSICPNELYAFEKRLDEFKNRNVEVIACSTDSEESHKAFLNTSKENGGIKGVTFPLISDMTKTISSSYGVLYGDYSLNEEDQLTCDGPMIPLRGTFLIDKNGVVQYQTVNFFTLQRNVSEVIRMIDSLIYFEEKGESCLAN